jgi:hypothetical protein
VDVVKTDSIAEAIQAETMGEHKLAPPLDPESPAALLFELVLVLGLFWLPYTLAAIDRYWSPLGTSQLWQAALGSGWAELARVAFQPLIVFWIVALHRGGLRTITKKPRWQT